MNLSIESLSEMRAFTGAPVEKEINWKQDGKEVTVTTYVRRLSYQSAMSEIEAHKNKGDLTASRIAACICDEHGKPVFTPADITGDADPERGPLNGNLTMALLKAISEVNDLGKPRS